jgi:hypothetical protein
MFGRKLVLAGVLISLSACGSGVSNDSGASANESTVLATGSSDGYRWTLRAFAVAHGASFCLSFNPAKPGVASSSGCDFGDRGGAASWMLSGNPGPGGVGSFDAGPVPGGTATVVVTPATSSCRVENITTEALPAWAPKHEDRYFYVFYPELCNFASETLLRANGSKIATRS